MKNSILVLLVMGLAGVAVAQDSQIEAYDGRQCTTCIVRNQLSAVTSPPQALRNDALLSAGAERSRVTANAASENALRVGLVQTVNEVEDEHGIRGRTQGNGLIVSPCFILTNHHAIYGDNRWIELSKDHSIEFFYGQSTTMFKWRTSGTPSDWGIRTSAGGGDWALVRLDSCPGKRVGWPALDLRTADQLANQPFTLVGIAPETSNGMVSTQPCLFRGRLAANGGVRHNCATADGWSGAGMFTSGNRLAAIHVGIYRQEIFAITMAEIFSNPRARFIVETDKAQFDLRLP